MNEGFEVRYALPEDIPWLTEVDRWPRAEDWRRKLEAREVVVAELGGKLSAHLRFDVLWSTVPFLALINVLPDKRGQGLSRQLLEFLEAELQARRYRALLSSSQTDEPAAQRWHLHMGFHSNGVIENIADEGVGELVFRKLLRE